MTRIISEGELRDLIGEIVVGVAGSPDGTEVTREVKVIMRLIKKYSKEQALVNALDEIRKVVEDTEEQETTIDSFTSWTHDKALSDIHVLAQEALIELKV